jgi:hypothetical protein
MSTTREAIVLYLVIEHFVSGPPKTFGEYAHRKEFGQVTVGDSLMLMTSTGYPAYTVRVEKIHDGTLHVISHLTLSEIDNARAAEDEIAADAELMP